MTRAEFLKFFLFSPVAAGLIGHETKASEPISATIPPVSPASHYWDKKTRLTISMWDFSWLTDQGKGGSFEHLEKRVEEAAERGYNTLRIDCFPSRLLEKSTSFTREYNPGMAKTMPCWGQVTTDFECNALERLKQLAGLCCKHGIWLGLDSWEKGHMMGHRQCPLVLDKDRSVIPVQEEEKALRDFAHVWVKALKLMREEGILERAVWVAPMNEVPHFASRSLESVRTIGAINQNEGAVKVDKNRLLNERFREINHWLGEEIKEDIRRDNLPLSYSSLGGEEYSKRLTEIYDVVDVHFMPDVIRNPEEKEMFEAIATGASGALNFLRYEALDLKRYSDLWAKTCRTHYAAMLQRSRDFLTSALRHSVFPSGKRMQAVITEAFGPCFWPDRSEVDWTWYKYYNGDSARIAACMPFEGVSLSNYAEPLFTLWDDVDWHRNANLFILNK